MVALNKRIWWQPTALYRAWDWDRRLLYAGISAYPEARMDQHKRQSKWSDYMRHATATWFPDRYAASTAEVAAIRAEHPQWNVEHSVCQCGRGSCSICSDSSSTSIRYWRSRKGSAFIAPPGHTCPSHWAVVPVRGIEIWPLSAPDPSDPLAPWEPVWRAA